MREIVTTTVLTPSTGAQTIEGSAVANPLDLTVLETVKDEFSIPSGTTTQDAWINRAIQRGSAAIQNYCNRIFSIQEYQDQIWLQADDYPYQVPGRVAPLQLSTWPLVAVSPSLVSVTSCVVLQGINSNQTLVEGTDFTSDYVNGQLVRLNVYNKFPTNWDAAPTTVQYTAGYAVIPADLEDALLRWIAGAYSARTRDPNLKEEEQPGLGRKVYWIPNAPSSYFPPEVAELLEKYRVPVVN